MIFCLLFQKGRKCSGENYETKFTEIFPAVHDVITEWKNFGKK